MTSKEFYLWLNGYLEALESENITECKIQNIRKKMSQVRDNKSMTERVVYGPDISNKQIQRPEDIYPSTPPKSVTPSDIKTSAYSPK